MTRDGPLALAFMLISFVWTMYAIFHKKLEVMANCKSFSLFDAFQMALLHGSVWLGIFVSAEALDIVVHRSFISTTFYLTLISGPLFLMKKHKESL